MFKFARTIIGASMLASCLNTNATQKWLVADNEGHIIKAEIPCYETDSLFDTLKKDYKEVPIVYGLTNDMAESTMSLWTNPSNKSWTIVATKGNVSCVVGAGTDFKLVPLRVGKTI